VADEAIENSQAQWFWRMLSSTVVTARANEISSRGVVVKPAKASESFMHAAAGQHRARKAPGLRRKGLLERTAHPAREYAPCRSNMQRGQPPSRKRHFLD
jgi:hypothetical protein